jgi:hypothetical protein
MNNAEHCKTLIRELTSSGIKPNVEPTHGGHIRIAWTVSGRKQQIITSATPSDNRATLNARARIRRLLREVNTPVSPPAPPSLLDKVLAVPEPVEPLTDRVVRLEEDVATLLDMLCDLQTRSQAPLPSKAVVRQPRKIRCWVLRFLSYNDFTPVVKIALESGKSHNAVAVCLSIAKRRGLVANEPRVGWRKLPLAVSCG